MRFPLRNLYVLVILALLAAALPAARPVHAATITVSSLNDSGSGTLREALTNANSGDTIEFSVSGTIQLASSLPFVTQGNLTIDAGTSHNVVLDGTVAGVSHGLRITSANNTIRGLVIINFEGGTLESSGGSGIYISGTGATGNQVYNCYLGVATNGDDAAGNDKYGIFIDNGASSNQIGGTGANEGNVISGNGIADVNIAALSGVDLVQNNVIAGNRIGTNADGDDQINGVSSSGFIGGVAIGKYAYDNVIGPDNIIAGHENSTDQVAGITLSSDSLSPGDIIPRRNRIEDNYIGLNSSGSPIANRIGIRFIGGARYGAIDTTISGNYISGNTEIGIEIPDSTSAFYGIGDTTIISNVIGLTPAGDTLPNQDHGIYIGTNAISNTMTVGPGNVISANQGDGIRIYSSNNVIQGNFIGTNLTGSTSSTSLINTGAGIRIVNGDSNTIGGTGPGERNVLARGGSSGNYSSILIQPTTGNSAANNVIAGNFIGVNAAGTAALMPVETTSSYGVRIDGSSGNTIEANVISGGGYGIALDKISGTGEDDNTIIRDNYIGTKANGGTDAGSALSNRYHGIYIVNGTGHVIEGNVIANNGAASTVLTKYHGIRIYGSAGLLSNMTVRDNQLVRNGSAAGGHGISIQNADQVTITRSSTRENYGNGIALNSANNDIGAPSLQTPELVSSTPTLSGTVSGGCDICTIEVFTSATRDDGEGPYYLTSGTTDGSGNFGIDISGCSTYLSATATDTNGNTSIFSSPMVQAPGGLCTPPDFTLASAAPQDAYAGSTVTYTHRLTNNDAVTRTFQVARTTSQGWAGTPDPTSVELGDGQFTNITIAVNVPPDATIGMVDTTRITVTAGATARSVSDVTTVQDAPSPNVAITPDQLQEITPGTGTVIFTHTVTNTGGLSGNFTLDAAPVGSLPAGWSIVSANLGQSTLDPGASTDAVLTIQVPTSPAPEANTEAIVRLTAGVDGKTDTADDTTRVLFTPGLEFSTSPQTPIESPPGVTVVFTHTLTNTGNLTDTFTVLGTDVPSGWQVQPVTVTLSRDTSQDIPVQVTVPPGLAASPPAYDVDITARRTANPTLDITRTDQISITSAPAPDINPAAPQSVNVIDAAQTVTFTHTLTNTGNVSGTFSITRTLPIGWNGDPIDSTCGDPAGIPVSGTCTFTFTVTVPQDNDAGSYNVAVRAVADHATAASDTVNDVVIVESAAGVILAPDYTDSGDPGEVLTYTHTLTNTGNGTDSYTLTLGLDDARWTANVTPTMLTDVPRGEARTVTVTVTVPEGVLADPANAGIATITATSVVDPLVNDTAVVTTSINAVDGAVIDPLTQSTNATPTDTEPDVVTFTHKLTNTGSTQIAYTFQNSDTRSSESWTSDVEPDPTAALAPGETVTITVSVTAPAGASNNITNTTTITVNAQGQTEALAVAEDITRIGPQFGILLDPLVNVGTALPGATQSYTHTLTNIGSTTDSFVLTTTHGLGWETVAAPVRIDLAPGEQTEIIVTVRTSPSALSGTLGTALLYVQSTVNPDTNALAEERTTILQVASVNISPPQSVGVNPSSGVVTLDHTLKNLGNGVDTFTLTVESTLGWETTITPVEQTLGVGRSYPVRVTVRVPDGIEPGTFDLVWVTAESRADPGVRSRVRHVLNYPRTQSATPIFKVYMPIVHR